MEFTVPTDNHRVFTWSKAKKQKRVAKKIRAGAKFNKGRGMGGKGGKGPGRGRGGGKGRGKGKKKPGPADDDDDHQGPDPVRRRLSFRADAGENQKDAETIDTVEIDDGVESHPVEPPEVENVDIKENLKSQVAEAEDLFETETVAEHTDLEGLAPASSSSAAAPEPSAPSAQSSLSAAAVAETSVVDAEVGSAVVASRAGDASRASGVRGPKVHHTPPTLSSISPPGCSILLNRILSELLCLYCWSVHCYCNMVSY